MKIGFYFEDSSISNDVDMTKPYNGNPGMGGTQYMFLMLAYYYNAKYNDEIIFFRHKNNDLPSGISSIVINDSKEIIDSIKRENIDLFVFSTLGKNHEFYDAVENNKIKSIAWAHNFFSMSDAKILNDNKYIRRVVFVGKQQYDRYIDHNIVKKSTYIYNMFYTDTVKYTRKKDYDLNVTYTGSLTEAKGFHILAEIWKDVLKEVPNAKLHVIGSGKLYDSNTKLGKYGISTDNYENKFMRYITDKNGDILDSVCFHGTVGQEKIEIYKNTAVGVVNPTGFTETFCISAVEMEACGIPIVTISKHGLIDTVKNNKTGLTFINKRGFKKNIIKLLKDKEYNDKIGQQAQVFVENKFSPEVIIEQWRILFYDIENDIKKLKPSYPYFKDYKWIRIMISTLKNIPIFKNIVSFGECTEFIREVKSKWKK